MHSFSDPMLGNCPFLLLYTKYRQSHLTHTRDMGVIVSSDSSPSVHITDIGPLTSWFNTHISRYSFTTRAFLVFVRPIVEHNLIIGSPSTARDIDAVESVQRRFTKRLLTLRNLSYRERLKCLNIFS